MGADVNLLEDQVRGLTCVGSRSWARIIGITMIVLFAGSSAFGDFLIQPIIIKKQVQPGRRIPIPFKVENMGRDTTERVTLRFAELTQDIRGVWKEVDPNDPNNTVAMSKLRSCKSWLRCDVQEVTVDPIQVVPITMFATIPPGTRGYYFAAMIASTEPRQTDIDGPYGGALVTLRYIVPIVLESQAGMPLPADIDLTDVGMEYLPPTLENPTAAVTASMYVTNNGGTYSRLLGVLRVLQDVGGNWRRIADLKLSPLGIIPGVSLKLTQDVGTLLPSGRYRVEGYLYVDGRRGSAYEREFDFQGDRRVVDPRMLAPIDLDKEDLFIDIVPGSSRGAPILVTNVSEDPVTVTVECVPPVQMHNFVNGRNLRGNDLSCADWAVVMPAQFTLQRYTRRNVNVNMRVPAAATQYSHYYATLRFHTTYADGSSAGTKTVNVCLANTRTTAKNLIDSEFLTLAETTPGRYIATATFANGGTTYVNPRCRGLVTGGTGDQRINQFLMEASGQEGILLPFEKRTFSGVLDVADIPVGDYRLTAILVEANDPDQMIAEDAQNQIIITVSEENGQKVARTGGWDKAVGGTTGRTLIKL